jgi:hypothetical protein
MARPERERPRRLPSDRLLDVIFGDRDHREDDLAAARRQRTLRAIVAVALASGVLSLPHLATAPLLKPPDEQPHVTYAMAVGIGELPVVTDFVDRARMPELHPRVGQQVANHPPFVYAVLAIPLRIFELAGASLGGVYAARAVVLLTAVAGYLVLGWLLLLLFPTRPSMALVATAVAAFVTNHVHIAAIVYNDAPAFLIITGLMLAAVIVLQRGPTRGRLLTLTALAVVAANTRAVGAAAAGLVAGAAGIAALLHVHGRATARLRRAVLYGALVGGTAFVSSIWFYALNWRRYGSPTGAAFLLRVHGRDPHPYSPLELLVHLPYWRSHATTQFFSRIETHAVGDPYLPWGMIAAARWVTAGLVVAVAVAVVWRLAAGSWRRPLPLAASWALVVVWFLALAYAMADFVSDGGGPHARYLWPAIVTLAAGAAVGLRILPGNRRGAPAFAFVTFQLACVAVATVTFVYRHDMPGRPSPMHRLAESAPVAAGAVLAVAGLVTALLVGYWALAVWKLAPFDDRPGPVAAPAGWGALRLGGPAGRSIQLPWVDAALALGATVLIGLLASGLLNTPWALVVTLGAGAAVVIVAAAGRPGVASQAPVGDNRQEKEARRR